MAGGMKSSIVAATALALGSTGVCAEGLDKNKPLDKETAKKQLIAQVRGKCADILTPDQLSGLTAIDMNNLRKELGHDEVQEALGKSFDINENGTLDYSEIQHLENTYPQDDAPADIAAMHTDGNSALDKSDPKYKQYEAILNELGSHNAYVAYDIVTQDLDYELFKKYNEKLGGEMPQFAVELVKGREEFMKTKKLGDFYKKLEKKEKNAKNESKRLKIKKVKDTYPTRAWDKFLGQFLEGEVYTGYNSINIDAPGLTEYIANNHDHLSEKQPKMAKVFKLIKAMQDTLIAMGYLEELREELKQSKESLKRKEEILALTEKIINNYKKMK